MAGIAFCYHDKYFCSVQNSPNGEVSKATLFRYRELPPAAGGAPTIVWATYRGGHILWGTLAGTKAPDGSLSFCYQHVNLKGELRTGCCESDPRLLENGLIELEERWRRTNGDGSTGASVVREIIPSRESVEGL